MTETSYASGRRQSPLTPTIETTFADARSLAALRDVIYATAMEAGMSAQRIDEFVLAVHEVAANSIRHGGGQGRVRMWAFPLEIVCEVSDKGRFDEPGITPQCPRPDVVNGRGLWMANRLCDLVELQTDATGSVIRLHKQL